MTTSFHATDCAMTEVPAAVHVDGTVNNPRDTDRGWSVEIAMPWRAFDRHPGAGRTPKPGDHWRVNFSRVEWDHIDVDGHYTKIQGRPDLQLLQTVMLRSLRQAMYSPDNVGHFGLAYEAYTHFTSPIRRCANCWPSISTAGWKR